MGGKLIFYWGGAGGIYVGNYLQREKYSIPYKVKSSSKVDCTLINM